MTHRSKATAALLFMAAANQSATKARAALAMSLAALPPTTDNAEEATA